MNENEAVLFAETAALKAVLISLLMLNANNKALGALIDQNLERCMAELLPMQLPDVAVDRFQSSGQALRKLLPQWDGKL